MSAESALQTETLADLIETLARERPNSVALWWGGRAISFRELNERANQLAHAFLSSPRRTRVAVLGRDSEQSFVVLFGAAKACMPVTFVNWRLTPSETRVILDDCRVSHLFVEASQATTARETLAGLADSEIEVVSFGALSGLGTSLSSWTRERATTPPEVRPSPQDVAVVLYTSGTTGLPKGVLLPQCAFLAIRRELSRAGQDWWGFAAEDIALHSLPLFHVGGLWWAANVLAAGASLVITSQFDPDAALRLIDSHRVTLACWVPAMLRMVLTRRALGKHTRSLRSIFYGGAPIDAELLAATRNAFGCRLTQFYGLTETGNTAICLRDVDHVVQGPRLAAAGLPYPGVGLRCVNTAGFDCQAHEVGEIWLRSPANMLGYWNRPEETAKTLQEGWVRTGDAGYLDAEGYLYICDRIKDMIISAGENIYPAEIERALLQHPAVEEVAVIGVPDERWGEAVKAVVAVKHAVSQKDLLEFLRGRIAEFKLPRSVEFLEALPRTPSGKVKKHELRAPHWAGRSRQVN
jgi:long-chain acyl-CoA synthetase